MMKLFNKMYCLVLALAVVFTLNNCSTDQISPQNEEGISTKDDMFAKKKVSSASGQAGLFFESDDGGFNGYQSHSFHVTKDADGNVKGSWQTNYNDSENDAYDVIVHGNVDCVTFVGNRAIITGTITHVNIGEYWGPDPGDPWWDGIQVGYYAYFEVVDNGEGSKSDPDQFSDSYMGIWYLYCDVDWDVPKYDIYNGNIQVKN